MTEIRKPVRPVLLACALLTVGPGVCAQQGASEQQPSPSARERAFVEIDAPANAFVSQPVEMAVTIGYDEQWFAEHAVSMFRQKVDVPFHIDVPWLLADPGRAVTLVPEPDEVSAVRVAIGQRIVPCRKLASVQRQGREFARVQLLCRWVPLKDGKADLAPVRLRFTYAEEFRDNLLRGREPVDQQQASVSSRAASLQVAALPADAPALWTGAVGEFAVEATSGGEQVHVGETFSVEVTIRGDGNLDRFAAMRAPTIDGFHVQGVVERRLEGARRFVLDVLALRPGVTEMPGVSFVAFSPLERRYVSVSSESVPVSVLPQREGVELPDAIQEMVDDDFARQNPGLPTSVYRWGFVALAVLGLLMHRRSQTRRGHKKLLDCVHELRMALTKDAVPDRVADAFEKVMAELGGGGGFSAPSVWKDLAARGVAAEGLSQLQSVHAQLDAARFGGPMPAAEDVMGPVDTLVAAAK